MKYKVGDRVRIKTWKEMTSEYGRREDVFCITVPNCGFSFIKDMEQELNNDFLDRILTIKEIVGDFYHMEVSSKWYWEEFMIKGLAKEDCVFSTSIESRFELMIFD